MRFFGGGGIQAREQDFFLCVRALLKAKGERRGPTTVPGSSDASLSAFKKHWLPV